MLAVGFQVGTDSRAFGLMALAKHRAGARIADLARLACVAARATMNGAGLQVDTGTRTKGLVGLA